MEKNLTTELYETDLLTGLHGNHAFLAKLSALCQAKQPCEIMILGIDNFRTINNLYSYTFGDRVLQCFTAELQDILLPDAHLFRLDGDNFGVVYVGEPDGQCEQMYKRILKCPRRVDELSVLFTVSGGICYYPAHGEDANTLYSNATLALLQSKNSTKNCLRYYSPDISERIKRDMLLLEQLRNSVANDFQGFSLHYQPIIENETQSIYGCEALLRWEGELFPEGVTPYQFVPLLERSGLIFDVGRWIITTAIQQCAEWQKAAPAFCININVSACQLDDEQFVEFIVQTASHFGVPPQTITIELTESERNDFEKIQRFFDYLRKQGMQTALDDFGTGYASLDIFRLVSADELKIDRSFLVRITDNVTDQIMLKSLLDMCRKMNIVVCVEGIENKEIEKIMAEMQPHLLQGFLYSRPIKPAEFEQRYIRTHEARAQAKETYSPLVYTQYRPAKPMTFSEIVNNANSGIFQVGMDQEFTFLTCNEGYRRMLGYTARQMEEKFGNKALGFVHPDDTAWVNEEIREQLSVGDVVNIEFRVVRADGRPIWILGTGNVVRSKDGNPSLIVNIIENDNRKRETLHMEARLADYEKILAALPTGIKYIRYDPDFTIEYISPGFLSILGYTRQDVHDLFDDKYINLIYEEDRQKVFNDALDQVQQSDVVQLYYRSVCKDGRLLWMETVSRLLPADADGIQRCCSSVVNVTETITDEKKSRAVNIANRLQKAAKLWGEVLYEYNFVTRQLLVSESFASLFGYELPENGLIDLPLVLGTGAAEFLSFLEQVREGESPIPIELPLNHASGKQVWCRIFAHPPEQIGDSNISVIGKFADIDEEHAERERLRVASQTDSLTGFFNKGSVEMRISMQLNEHPDATYFCLVLDLDDFKLVNDSYGHFSGDKLLHMVAERIRQSFRSTDILGRIGGDEFLIFANGKADFDWLNTKVSQLLDLLQEPIDINENKMIPSVSIGVARYPKDGSNFSELYQNADKALYRAKNAGKHGIHFYSK